MKSAHESEWKKLFPMVLVICLLTGVLSACSGKGSENKQTETQSTKVDSGKQTTQTTGSKSSLYIEGSEGVTLTYWVPMDSNATKEYASLAEHPYFIWLKEQTGVNIEFIHPSDEQMDTQLNLMIASSKYYDILGSPWYPGGPQAGIDEKCFVDLRPYLDQYLPDYKAALECEDGSFGAWEWGPEKELYKPVPQPAFKQTCTTSSGALFCVSQIWTEAYLPEVGPMIRKDWLDEAGLEVPETLEELELVLEAFKKRGNDVVPMNLGNDGTNSSDGGIISAFDMYASYLTINKERTQVLPSAYTQDGFKDYLTLMNDWYKKGYIDPDFMNRNTEALDAMFLDDRLGIYFGQWGTPQYWKENYSGQQKFEVVPMALPRKTKDQQLKWVQTWSSAPTNYACITTSCQNPEIAAAWLNVGFKKEAILRNTYGVEGDTYELRDGVPYYTDKVYEKDNASFFSCTLYPNGCGYNSLRSTLIRGDKDSASKLSESAQCGLKWGENASPDTNWGYVTFEDDNYGKYEAAWNDAMTYTAPEVLKFIIGERDLSEFDDFRKNVKSLGMDEAIRIGQEALDTMNGKK